MIITDEMVEQRINSLRELHNNPELYDLLKIVVRENMTSTPRLIAQGMREAAKLCRSSFLDGQDILARAQEIDPNLRASERFKVD